MEPPKPKRLRFNAKKHKDRRVLRIIVSQPGPIEIRDGTHRGHPADLIEAPEGTKIERPKE